MSDWSYDPERECWLYNEQTKEVTFSNNVARTNDLKQKGFKETGEEYATYWLMDNGYRYI